MTKRALDGVARQTAAAEAAKRRAAVVLKCEALLGAGLPLAVVLIGFLGIALLTLPQSLGQITGGWGQLALLIGFAVSAAFSLRYFIITLRWPKAQAIRRRVEQASGLPHRPITQLEDHAVTAGPLSVALWQAHQARLAQQTALLRAGTPRPMLAAKDQFGIVGLALLVLAAGLIVGGQDGRQHIINAVSVNLDFGPQKPPAVVDVWVNPPAYTRLTPVLLSRQKAATDDLPAAGPANQEIAIGSAFFAKVSGADTAPVLTIKNQAGQSEQVFESAGDDSYQLTSIVANSGSYEISLDGDRHSSWTLSVIADQKPTISFRRPPSVSERGALRLDYLATDDYGVTGVQAQIFRLDAAGNRSSDSPIAINAQLPNRNRDQIAGRRFADLTPHPWAGLAVEIELRAEDALGQQSRSEAQRLTLPERRFQHPVARAIIAQRQRLARSPAEQRDIAKVLIALAARPQDYGHDLVVFLGLKAASARLFIDRVGTHRATVLPLLWETALRVENGELATAEQRLHDLEQKLQEALARNADSAEIEKLLDQLQSAIDQYMRQLAKKMQALEQQAGAAENLENIDPQQLLRPENLQNMLESARQQLRQGDRDAAKRMLSQLQEMMQNLRIGKMPQMSPQQRAMRQLTQRLQNLSRRQQSLMDQTYRQNQQGQRQAPTNSQPNGQNRQGQPQNGQGKPTDPGGTPAPGQSLAEMQEQLRRELGDLMRTLSDGTGNIPKGLGQAERAMKDAAGALQQGKPGDALGPQSDALARMRDGGQQMLEQLRQQMAKGQQGNAPGQEPQSGQGDPLRPSSRQGQYNQGDLRLPTERQSQRVRDIFNELQRRSGDQDRAPVERQYLDRLLKRF